MHDDPLSDKSKHPKVDVGKHPTFRYVEETCPVCDEGSLVEDVRHTEKFCDTCLTVISKETFREEKARTEWEQFISYRNANYSGFHGSERVKMVGGFANIYDFEEDF